jgi:hypothetical protein
MQVSKDELIDGSKGSYRHAYCPAESMDQHLLALTGGALSTLDGEEGRRQPRPLLELSHAAISAMAVCCCAPRPEILYSRAHFGLLTLRAAARLAPCR